MAITVVGSFTYPAVGDAERRPGGTFRPNRLLPVRSRWPTAAKRSAIDRVDSGQNRCTDGEHRDRRSRHEHRQLAVSATSTGLYCSIESIPARPDVQIGIVAEPKYLEAVSRSILRASHENSFRVVARRTDARLRCFLTEPTEMPSVSAIERSSRSE